MTWSVWVITVPALVLNVAMFLYGIWSHNFVTVWLAIVGVLFCFMRPNNPFKEG